MDAILLWLWRKFTAFIEGALDPDSAARAKAFEEKVAAQEQRAKDAEQLALQSEAAYQASTARRKEWDRLAVESELQEKASEERFIAAEVRIAARENEALEAKKRIADRADADVLRDRL